MASESFDFEQVARVTTGAVGEPGKRALYLQVRTDAQLVSLAIEKDQLKVLSERLQEVFSQVPAPPAGKLPDMALEEPIVPIWRVGFMTLTYSQDEKAFEVSLVELVDEGDQLAQGDFEGSLPQVIGRAQLWTPVTYRGRLPCPP